MIRSKRAQDKYRPAQGGVYSPEQVQEVLVCLKDPKYFISTYLAIAGARGMKPLILRPEQEGYIDAIHLNDATICKHPRQAGISTASIAYLLWETQFKFDHSTLVVLPSYQHATFAKDQFRMMLANVPEYLKTDITYENRHSIEFTNGSRISFVAASDSSGRGMSISTLYIGDLAYIDSIRAYAMWHNLMPCIGTGSKFIIHSTPSDPFSLFCDIWEAAESGAVPIHAHSISFWQLYDASQAKWDTLAAQLDARTMRRSYGCEFVT